MGANKKRANKHKHSHTKVDIRHRKRIATTLDFHLRQHLGLLVNLDIEEYTPVSLGEAVAYLKVVVEKEVMCCTVLYCTAMHVCMYVSVGSKVVV